MKMDPTHHRQLCDAVLLANRFFKDAGKVSMWLRHPNRYIGGQAPQVMITRGKGEQLLKWMEQQIQENQPIESKVTP